MKLLLYCIKAKPYLYDDRITQGGYNAWYIKNNFQDSVNGKIIAECDFDVEEIDCLINTFTGGIIDYSGHIELRDIDLFKRSCLDLESLKRYLGKKGGYAIKIKNLHIFGEAKNLSDYMNCRFEEWDYRDLYELEKSPKNMQYVSTWGCDEISMWGNTYILVSVRPDNLCRILNGDKTIEIRKKVLKGMCK